MRRKTAARGANVLATGLVLTATMLAPAHSASVATHYGVLITTESGDLAVDGKMLPPRIGSHHLDFVKVFRFRGSDEILVRNMDLGTSAEAMYYLVRLSATGATCSDAFGTGAQATAASQNGDAVILRMPGYLGHTTPAAIRAAARERHVFRVVNGLVTEDGKPAQ